MMFQTRYAKFKKLTICIYHSCENMVNISYELMNKLNNNKLDIIETILYAISN